MKTLRDLIVLALTIGLQIYAILLAGRYFGYNETLMAAWAGAGVVGILLMDRYFAWWRR